jgi:predicted nucleic acid-binding protein
MKKLIAAALAASMLITSPAFAEHRKRDRDHSQQERRKSGCGWLCGAIIGGVVVGVLSSDNNRQHREREREQDYRDNRYYPPDYRYDRRYCVREQITEWHRGERYVYWETRCN